MKDYHIKWLESEEIDLIRPLWEKLNLLHLDLSSNFKKRFQEANWEKRKRKLIEKSSEILIETIVYGEDAIVGYCISTVDGVNSQIGEIDSIYIDEAYREYGLGKLLVNNAIDWLIEKGTTEQKLLVGVGNERVLDFYKQFDFLPLHIVLQRVEKTGLGK
jgi:diamine N-acetyltransferase